MNASSEGKFCRRRRTYSEEESQLSGWKLGVIVGVIIMCFAMLYPSMLHPLVTSLFLRTSPTPKTITNRPPIHPAMTSARFRPGLHQGLHYMRMAASQSDNTPSFTSSKGMFAWMLPIYTVGVVAFLIYTLIKSKKKRRTRRHNHSSTETESEDDFNHFNGRAGSTHIGKRKLEGLQERLKQTEIAMEKILEQLNTISTEAANVAKRSLMTETDNDNEDSVRRDVDQQDGKTEQYLRDLEEALRDFKQLSKKYRSQGQNDSSTVSDADSCNDESMEGCATTVKINKDSEGHKQNASNQYPKKRPKT
ncbi:unnamed protein product [Thelazia callipaeda]|uniref:RIC3 domain-containing protein n=1 Tax=Thelazia callipaeda TaxID=103827 RepID=A0A0N5CMB6_THECL|nr:unnamed protein product [Thelazia callipaeda]